MKEPFDEPADMLGDVMVTRSLIFVALFGLAFAASAKDQVAADQCLNGMAPTLESGQFSGSIDCQHDHLSIQKIGQVRGSGRIFTVYDYRYRLAPFCDVCAMHGGQRIIFMERGRYVGQYKPYAEQVTIRHGELVLVSRAALAEEPSAAVVVKITRKGPPTRILVDGEWLEFFR